MPVKPFSGLIAGYDPGGNGGHGLAVARFRSGECCEVQIETHRHAESVLSALEACGEISAIGIDTLAAWSTGDSGWRAADLWLRSNYQEVRPSIVSPNGLYGSMGLNGMAVLIAIRQAHPSIHVTETHPKVLYWALAGKKYRYYQASSAMDVDVSAWLGCGVSTKNDHEWDAVVSVLAAFKGISGEWARNLFEEPQVGTGRLVFPAGPAHYWWPG